MVVLCIHVGWCRHIGRWSVHLYAGIQPSNPSQLSLDSIYIYQSLELCLISGILSQYLWCLRLKYILEVFDHGQAGFGHMGSCLWIMFILFPTWSIWISHTGDTSSHWGHSELDTPELFPYSGIYFSFLGTRELLRNQNKFCSSSFITDALGID